MLLCPWAGGLRAGGTCRDGIVNCVGVDHTGQGLGRRPCCLEKGEWGPEKSVRDLAAPGREIITVIRVMSNVYQARPACQVPSQALYWLYLPDLRNNPRRQFSSRILFFSCTHFTEH